jgi:hypothetical protein
VAGEGLTDTAEPTRLTAGVVLGGGKIIPDKLGHREDHERLSRRLAKARESSRLIAGEGLLDRKGIVAILPAACRGRSGIVAPSRSGWF